MLQGRWMTQEGGDGGALLALNEIRTNTTCDLVRSWFRKGDSALDCGMIAAEQGKTFDVACFWARLAIERYFKGFLILHAKSWLNTHDLDELLRRCLEIEALPGITGESLKRISECVAGQNGSGINPDRSKARYALRVANGIKEVIMATVPDKAKP